MKANFKPNGFEYCEYVLVYFYDVLSGSHKPSVVMDCLHKLYHLKDPPANPERYLGEILGKYNFDNETVAWYHYSD